MTTQTDTNAAETNDAIAAAMKDYGLKTAQFINKYLEESAKRILDQSLEGRRAAEEIVAALSEAYNQASSLATSYARQADLYGMEGNRAWQDALDKTAFEQRQISEYLDRRLAEGLSDFGDFSKTVADSGIAKIVGQAGGILVDAYQVIDYLRKGDAEGVGATLAGALLGGIAAGAAVFLGAPVAVVAALGIGVSWVGEELFKEVYDDLVEWGADFLVWWDPLGIMPDVNGDFLNARNWIQRRDPLTLDLDDDGLETTGIDPDNPILFDHDGDGTANATGWVKPDDGYLVFDRNENGLIDNGTELFGDSTPLLDENGEVVGNAADGFAALAAEDTNNDGNVDAGDANWDKLRVWQDLNSDGKTDEDELKTLEELGIAGFHVGKEENTQVLANGNAVADLGSYIRTDGSKGTLGEVTGNMADIDLIDNPFYREFSDTIPLTEQAKTLADMQGSGNVRDLREASSLSSSLANSVENYSAAETKVEQMALVDDLIEKWAASSNNPTSIEQAEAQGYRLQYLVPGLTPSMLSNAFFVSSGSSSGSGTVAYGPNTAQRRAELLAEQARVTELIALLGKFNGMTFVDIEPDGVRTGANTFVSVSSADTMMAA